MPGSAAAVSHVSDGEAMLAVGPCQSQHWRGGDAATQQGSSRHRCHSLESLISLGIKKYMLFKGQMLCLSVLYPIKMASESGVGAWPKLGAFKSANAVRKLVYSAQFTHRNTGRERLLKLLAVRRTAAPSPAVPQNIGRVR